MMKIMTEKLDITETEYRGLTLPSYSLLKKLDDSGPRSINRKYKFDSEAIDFGSLLDCKLLCPEEFSNKFYFDATEKPTGQVLELAEYLCSWDFIESVGDLSEYIKNNSAVEELSQNLGLFGGTKDYDKRVAKFDLDLFWNYIQVKINSFGKTVFTPETLSECAEAERILKTHPKTAHLFNLNKDQEALNQLMIITEVSGIKVKMMLDMVIIDHKKQTITPYDLKATEFRQVNFPYHFRKMKYYIQGGLYKTALINYCRDVLQLGYAIEDFKFIVYSRSDRYPFIWNMSYKWHTDAMSGFINDRGEKVKGVSELLDDYKYYAENDYYEIERCIIENEYLEL